VSLSIAAPRPAADSGQATQADRLRVCLVARQEPGTTGTSRYVDYLARDLRHHGVSVVFAGTQPGGGVARALTLARRAGMDVNTFLAQYPVALRWPKADIYHLTVQTYASVLLFSPPPGPVAVTVHDIIPYLTRHDRNLKAYGHPLHYVFDWLAMQGLRRAQHSGMILADSTWTKRTLIDALGLDKERIIVVPLGVDAERFHPGPVPDAFRDRYGLPVENEYFLYVGSEDPRKNLALLLHAFARVARTAPHVRLIKAGAAHHASERKHLERLAEDLGVRLMVRFLDHVAEEDLPLLYRTAAVCVLPSSYEGFGLPVLEAMACGTAVVCTAAASLPEVAGDAAQLTPLNNPEALADALLHLLHDPARRIEQTQRGLARAAQLTWQRTAASTFDQYQTIARGGLAQRSQPRYSPDVRL